NLPSTARAELLQSVLKSKVTLPRHDNDNGEWKSHLNNQNQQEIFLALVGDISNELDLDRLCRKISFNVWMLTKVERCLLYLIEGTDKSKELTCKSLYIDRQNLTATSLVASSPDLQLDRPWSQGIVGLVSQIGEVVKIDDATKDSRCRKEEMYLIGCKIDNLLCMPIKDSQGNVIGVVQAINKKSDGVGFSDEDVKVMETYLTFCGISITNAKLWRMIKKESERNKTLLELTHALFEEQTSPDRCIDSIMERSQMLLKCQKCCVLLVDNIATEDLRFSKVFELRGDTGEKQLYYYWTSINEIIMKSFTINPTFANTVVIASCHCYPDFEVYSLLAMPIRDNNLRIIGVAALINKMDGKNFDKDDETAFEAFVIFCGLGIVNTMMYDSVCKAKAQQSVALEVCSYHATAPKDEVQRFQDQDVPSVANYNLQSLKFDDFSLDPDGMILASIRMFKECEFLQKFKIDYSTLCTWLLTVRKNYRNVAYHNWRHAFNVAQLMFAIIKNTKLGNTFSHIECLALIVGCICHDLDHRGTNNAYQIKSGSPLARLYSTSTMENHHFNHAVMILNTPGHNIFETFTSEEYSRLIDLIKQSILATDLALYFRNRENFFNLASNHEINFDDDLHKALIRSMLMTACDVGAITKPWTVERKVAELISAEFFEQGDLERQELNLEPQRLMDREKKDEIASMQVEFIDVICMPLYKAFAEQDTRLKSLLDGVVENRANWLKEDEMMRKRKQ
ncbi:uncharacterized protein TRIADDRAFT_10459, partial [Trichoplax adhaerens]